MPSLNYTTIHHETRKTLGLTANEYMIADLIYNLQNNQKAESPGWCYASKNKLADTLGLTRNGIQKIIGRLIELGLVVRGNKESLLKTTQEWYEKVVCINQTDDRIQRMQGVHTTYAEGAYKVTKSPGSYNNNNNNINNKDGSSGSIGEREKTLPAENSQTIGSLDNIREIIEHLRKCSGVNIRETQKKIDQARVRLKTFTKDEIMQAIANAFEDDFYGGRKTHWKADFDYIFRSDDTMDKMLNLKPRRDNGKILFQE